jgi:hypothetical protein
MTEKFLNRDSNGRRIFKSKPECGFGEVYHAVMNEKLERFDSKMGTISVQLIEVKSDIKELIKSINVNIEKSMTLSQKAINKSTSNAIWIKNFMWIIPLMIAIAGFVITMVAKG